MQSPRVGLRENHGKSTGKADVWGVKSLLSGRFFR
jgi:hypothetical protein